MNILYIDHYAGSPNMGMDFRPFYMAREWQKIGHKVRILGADYSHLRRIQPKIKCDFCKETIDGIEYQWIKAGTYTGNGIKRAFSMFRFVWKTWSHARQLKNDFNPDVVITSSTYPLDSYAGYHISKMSKAKYIHEAHDVWPLTLVELGGISKYNPFIILLEKAEKYAYKKSDIVVSVLPGTLSHMMEQGLQEENRFYYIPNGISVEDWSITEPLNMQHQKLFDRLHKENRFIVEYLGGHALSNALDQLLDAIKNIKDKNIAVVIIGKGIEKERLQKRSEDESINNVFFLPPISKKQVPYALQEADALYIGAVKSPLYRFGVSMNKIYDYMMSEKPILNGIVASNNEVEEAKCGISFDSSKPEEIAYSIDLLKGLSEEERCDMGRNGKNWVIEYRDYKKLAKNFIEIMKQIVE